MKPRQIIAFSILLSAFAWLVGYVIGIFATWGLFSRDGWYRKGARKT